MFYKLAARPVAGWAAVLQLASLLLVVVVVVTSEMDADGSLRGGGSDGGHACAQTGLQTMICRPVGVVDISRPQGQAQDTTTTTTTASRRRNFVKLLATLEAKNKLNR